MVLAEAQYKQRKIMIMSKNCFFGKKSGKEVVGCGNKTSNLLKIENVFAAVSLHISRKLIQIT